MKLENYKLKELKKKRNTLYEKRRYHSDKAEAYQIVLDDVNREFVRRFVIDIKKKVKSRQHKIR